MPHQLSEEQIEEIYEVWDGMDDPSYSAVAEEVGVNRDTVSKYIKDREEDDAEGAEDLEDVPSVAPDTERESLFPDPGEEAAEKFKTFFQQLNKKYGIGIKEKAIKMMAGEVQNTGMLPQPDSVAGFLESADTGIKNTQDIMWIARQYGLWLQKYQAERDQASMMGQGGARPLGDYGPGSRRAGGPHGLTEGGYRIGGQGGPGAPGMGQMGGAGVGMDPQAMMFQQLQQQIARLEQQLQNERQSSDTDMLKRKTEEFLENRLEQLIDAESTEEREMVVAELRQLRQEMAQGGAREPVELGENWRTDLIELARSGDIEFSEAKEILEEVGEVETNPDVLEKKYDKDIEEMRLKHETQRYEKLGGLFEKAVEAGGRELGKAIVEGGDEAEGDSEPAEQEAEEPPAADGGQAVAKGGAPSPAGDCPKCGETMYQNVNGTFCTDCEFGYGTCDHCAEPVEVPPIGEAPLGFCPTCANDPTVADIEDITLERTGDPDADHACLNCEWTGTEADLVSEGMRCGSCRSVLPIGRLNPHQGATPPQGAD